MGFASKSAVLVADVPADIDAALAQPDWRDRLIWPVSLLEAQRISREQTRDTLIFVGRIQDAAARDTALLALPTVLAYARAIVLAALAVNRAALGGMRLVGVAPEFGYLQTGKELPAGREELILLPVKVRLALARRIARIHSWSGVGRLLRSVVRSDVLAVGHNELLRAAAAQEKRAVGFQYPEIILDTARRNSAATPDFDGMVSDFADALLGTVIADDPYRARARDLLQAVTSVQVRKAARDMAALRQVALPNEIWAGSGGVHASRAIGLEVLRRGGTVVRFDHGKPRGFVERREIDTVIEFSVCSEFVVSTSGVARLTELYSDRDLITWRSHPQIRGMGGDPVFARVPPGRRDKPASHRLRVVYAPTHILGFRQLIPAQLPDPLQLDWQMRVAEALKRLPVGLVCQPHPEGVLKGRPHPLETVAATTRGNFDAELRLADVFVFDSPSTTTLWQAVCTGARIVFLDIGSGELTPAIAELFRQRARVIDVDYDKCNRPILPFERLRDAVLDDTTPVDNMPLRRLLAGAH